MDRGGRPINAHIFFARDPRSSSPDHDVVLGDLCIDYMPEAASKILLPDVQFPLSVEKAHVAEVIETIKKGVIRLEFMVQGGGGDDQGGPSRNLQPLTRRSRLVGCANPERCLVRGITSLSMGDNPNMRVSVALLGMWVLGLGVACDTDRPDVSQAQPCRRAVAPLPAVDPRGAIRPALEQYLGQYADGGWSIGEGANGVSMTLPPGCGELADRIESHYGSAVRVQRDVLIRPLR